MPNQRIKPETEEKKVEYLELIYDLIFVYVIGRNNSLLHGIENGFVPPQQFAAYIVATLAVIQIWNFTTFYTNMFGRNSVRDHVFMFVNMYLLYYIGEGTNLGWASFYTQYHIAWALILINIGIQYILELRNHPEQANTQQTIRRMALVLFGEAALVLIGIAVPSGFSLVAILFGAGMTWVSQKGRNERIDFPHLTERVMLYVVFTFGEMIIGMTGYFEGSFTWRSLYFSVMGFLIVSALFLGYELLYNRIIDREMKTTGMAYMMIHIILVFSLNNLTTALEFMQEEEVALWPKILFLLGSFLLFYLCLFALMHFSREGMGVCRRFVLPVAGIALVFIVSMLLLREQMVVNIAISVVFVYAMFLRIFLYSRKQRAPAL